MTGGVRGASGGLPNSSCRPSPRARAVSAVRTGDELDDGDVFGWILSGDVLVASFVA